MSSIQEGPHYEIQSSELAAWLEQQGVDLWWNVDGDPLLTGRLTFPCPADELSAELRKLNRALLVQAPEGRFGGERPINRRKQSERDGCTVRGESQVCRPVARVG